MQVGGGDAPKEVASLEEFIGMLNGEPGGTFLLGGNRIWHGGIHLSDKGGWHPGGAVRAIADGEIVAYRIASDPVAVTLEPEKGKPGEPITLHTSPSFCLVRHRYEATEEVSGQQQPKSNTLTFYLKKNTGVNWFNPKGIGLSSETLSVTQGGLSLKTVLSLNR